jgi:hypothetical protein
MYSNIQQEFRKSDNGPSTQGGSQREGEGGGGGCASDNEYSCAHGAEINFGDLRPYLTYAYTPP